MESIQQHRILVKPGRWSIYGNYITLDGASRSLEGHVDTDLQENAWLFQQVFWVLAKNPNKITFKMQNAGFPTEQEQFKWTGKHSDLGDMAGSIVVHNQGFTKLFGSADLIGSESFFSEGDRTYRAHGLILRNHRRYAVWSAVYKFLK